MKRIILYIVLLCLCAVTQTAAQTHAPLRSVSIDEGLSGDCVYCILKDSRGLTWVGTNNGVSLYDGRHVTSIPCDARRSMNLVHDLAELPDGSIVAAMRAGVYKLTIDNGQWKIENCQLSIPISDARSLLVMGDTLIVGSRSGLMMVLPQQGWKTTELTLGSSRMARDNRIVDVCADGKHGAWVISNSALFHLSRDMKIKREDVDFSAVRDGLRCVCAAGDKVYIGTSWQGLLRYAPAQHSLTTVEMLDEGVVADLHTDGAGHLFVAMDGAGAVEIDTTGDSIVSRYAMENGPLGPQGCLTLQELTARPKDASTLRRMDNCLPTNSVYTYWREPRTGLSFFGFYRQGMAHSLYVNPIVQTYSMGEFDSSRLSVRSFCIHASWKAIGTRDGLWLVNEQTGEVHYFGSDEMGGANVLSIEWFAGRFVVATFDGGLCYIDPQAGTATRPDEETLRKGNFTKVGAVPMSSALMAISDRVVILDDSLRIRQQFDSRNSGLSGAALTDFIFDHTGKAWLAGGDGLAIYDPANGVIQRTDFPVGFFNKEIAMHFALDTNGDVLAVSENNLYRCRPDLSKWDSLDIADYLDVGTMSFIAPCSDGYWVGTDRGLFLMDSLSMRFRHYGKSEGLTSLFCNPQSWQVDSAGTFWFTTWNGLHQIGVKSEGVKSEKCIRLSAQPDDGSISVGWNFGQEALEIAPMLLDYADGRACYLEWNVDDGPMQVTTERRPIRIAGLGLGRHELRIYVPGEQQAATYTISVWPNAAFWFEVLFAVMLIVSFPLLIQYQRRVARARALHKRKRAIELELHAQKAVKRHVQEEEQRRQEAEEARKAAMYQRSRSSQEENRKLYRALRTLMEDEHPYRQADLRVADVAKALDSTPNKVSQMLSQYAKVTFYDFINDYRIEEFKRRAVSDKFAHLSTLAIAEKCGFKKTTFYSAFAKKEGCTPSEWIARHRKKR